MSRVRRAAHVPRLDVFDALPVADRPILLLSGVVKFSQLRIFDFFIGFAVAAELAREGVERFSMTR